MTLEDKHTQPDLGRNLLETLAWIAENFIIMGKTLKEELQKISDPITLISPQHPVLGEQKRSAQESPPIPLSNTRVKEEPAVYPDYFYPDTLHLLGLPDKQRFCILINNKPVSMTECSLDLLLRLGIALKKGKPWQTREELEIADFRAQAITRLRSELKPHTLHHTGRIIANNGFGSYRLALNPERLSMDVEQFLQSPYVPWREIAQAWKKVENLARSTSGRTKLPPRGYLR